MATKSPIKRIRAEKVAVLHVCSQKESIAHLIENGNKLSVIITGNGDPEKGLCRQVALLGERQKGVLTTLDKIDEKLKDLNENHNVLLAEITRVGSDLVGFKSELTGEKAQKEKDDKEKKDKERDTIIAEELRLTKIRDRNWKIGTFITIILMALGTAYGIIKLYAGQDKIVNNQNKIVKKVDDFGTPVIVDKDGKTLDSRSVELKMWPKDFGNDSIK